MTDKSKKTTREKAIAELFPSSSASAEKMPAVTLAKMVANSLSKDPVNLLLVRKGIGDVGIRVIADHLPGNTALANLVLSSNDIGDQGAELLGSALRKNRSIVFLDLSYNKIGCAGATYIAQALLENRTLCCLKLYSNRIDSKGAAILGSALRSNDTLRQISLGGNQINATGLKALLDVFENNNSTLTDISLRGMLLQGEDKARVQRIIMRNRQIVACKDLFSTYTHSLTKFAFLKGLHPALGVNSPVNIIDQFCARNILDLLPPGKIEDNKPQGFFVAFFKGDLGPVRHLLKPQSIDRLRDPSFPDMPLLFLAIFCAAQFTHPENRRRAVCVIKELLAREADVFSTCFGKTPAAFAALLNCPLEIIQLLTPGLPPPTASIEGVSKFVAFK